MNKSKYIPKGQNENPISTCATEGKKLEVKLILELNISKGITEKISLSKYDNFKDFVDELSNKHGIHI